MNPNRTDLDQAGQLVAEAQERIDKNQYPKIWKALDDAWKGIDSQIDYESEQAKFEGDL